MRRAWFGMALLAGSWLLGLDYFAPASPVAWLCALVGATVLLSGLPLDVPPRRHLYFALVLVLPAAWLMPWPYKAIAVLISAGLLAQLAPIPPDWPRRLGRGAVAAGLILLAQSLALLAYTGLTARRHELPWPLVQLLGAVPRLLGLDTAVDGSTIVVRSVEETRRFGATWELLLDPSMICFLVGGLAVLGFTVHGGRLRGHRWGTFLRCGTSLLLVTLAWALLRAGLLVAMVLHRALRADVWTVPNVADVLVSVWIQLVLLGGLAWLSFRFLDPVLSGKGASHADDVGQASDDSGKPLAAGALILTGMGVAVLVLMLHWEPVGQRKGGRVMIVERHSTWEPTTEPYGTTIYGEAGSYNYAAVYDYCGQYFEMSRLLQSDAISDETLRRCDVLVIKTPTARYTPDEVAAVVQFVQDGGSLLLIGDHTNVFNMNTYLNDIGRHFGFTFRNDLLFRVGSPYKQRLKRPLLPHPIVQNLDRMDFAVSCSIDPGCSPGRMAIRSTGLWNLPPAYQESNYHPQAEYRSYMHYGAWCQLWSTSFGKGRVVAFADSTLFSNFCTFQPGKAELLVNMLEWLNHGGMFNRRWVRLLIVVPGGILGSLLTALGLWFGRGRAAWLMLPAAGLAGWAVASTILIAGHRAAMPAPRIERPMVHVVIDRTLSEVPLFTGAFTDGEEGVGYGMLEQWIPRIGNFISRQTGEEVFEGDAIVFICPTRSVSRDFRNRLVDFVASGGRVLVVDSIDVEGSTANSLLEPFDLASSHFTEQQPESRLRVEGDKVSEVPLQAACEITGGTPLAWLGEMPVAAQAHHGNGTVTAIGFGSLLNDANMGYHWMPEPEPETLQRYELLYFLLRASLPDRPVANPPAAEG